MYRPRADAFLLGKTSGIVQECSRCLRQKSGHSPCLNGCCSHHARHGSSGPWVEGLSLAVLQGLIQRKSTPSLSDHLDLEGLMPLETCINSKAMHVFWDKHLELTRKCSWCLRKIEHVTCSDEYRSRQAGRGSSGPIVEDLSLASVLGLIQRKSISSSLLSSSLDWIHRAESGKMKQLATRNSIGFGTWWSHNPSSFRDKLYQPLSFFLNLVVDRSV